MSKEMKPLDEQDEENVSGREACTVIEGMYGEALARYYKKVVDKDGNETAQDAIWVVPTPERLEQVRNQLEHITPNPRKTYEVNSPESTNWIADARARLRKPQN